MRADVTGRIWIERTGLRTGERGPVDLFDEGGRYIGTITGQTMPDAFSRSGLAAWIETGEFDVPIVTVRRLRAGWR
jgi:hypothetical protein